MESISLRNYVTPTLNGDGDDGDVVLYFGIRCFRNTHFQKHTFITYVYESVYHKAKKNLTCKYFLNSTVRMCIV